MIRYTLGSYRSSGESSGKEIENEMEASTEGKELRDITHCTPTMQKTRNWK